MILHPYGLALFVGALLEVVAAALLWRAATRARSSPGRLGAVLWGIAPVVALLSIGLRSEAQSLLLSMTVPALRVAALACVAVAIARRTAA